MGKIFKRGLFAIAPIALTIAIVAWLFEVLENIFGPPIKAVIGEYYFKGLGILVALLLIFFFGILVNNFLIQKLYRWSEQLLQRIPFIKSLYKSICDFFTFFRAKGAKEGKVVSLMVGDLRVIGIVTRENFDDLPPGIGKPDEVSVFIPLSYQIGGFYVTVPRSRLTPLDMKVEEAMRYVVMAGVQSKNGP